MLTQDKIDVLRHAFEQINSKPIKDDRASRLQRIRSEMAAQEHQRLEEKTHREETERKSKRFKEELSKLQEQNETLRADNKVRRWLPNCIFGLAVAVVCVYFFVLLLNGFHYQGFELGSTVLSSIGISAVGGSLALVGFILQGLFKTAPQKNKKN